MTVIVSADGVKTGIVAVTGGNPPNGAAMALVMEYRAGSAEPRRGASPPR